MSKRLTAEAVWRAFIASGKRHIVITGERGSGKTTLFEALRGLLPEESAGYVTRAIPKKQVLLRNLRSGEERCVARFHPELPGIDHKMVPEETTFLTAVRGALGAAPWLCVDEIGYLEAELSEFQTIVQEQLQQKRLLCTVRKDELPLLNALRRREDALLVDLDAPFGSAGVVIMASGAGKRFGSNKLLADFGGRPLYESAMELTAHPALRRVLVTRYEELAEAGDALLHACTEKSATIRLGTERLRDCERLCFLTADQPLLTWSSLSALLLLAANEAERICRLVCGDIPGSPVVFPKSCYPELMSLRGEESGKVVIRAHRERVLTLQAEEKELRDVDTPEDLAELLKMR